MLQSRPDCKRLWTYRSLAGELPVLLTNSSSRSDLFPTRIIMLFGLIDCRASSSHPRQSLKLCEFERSNTSTVTIALFTQPLEVGSSDRPVILLSRCVPYLNFDFTTVNPDDFRPEFDANRRIFALGELLLDESCHYTRLSDKGVPDDDKF